MAREQLAKLCLDWQALYNSSKDFTTSNATAITKAIKQLMSQHAELTAVATQRSIHTNAAAGSGRGGRLTASQAKAVLLGAEKCAREAEQRAQELQQENEQLRAHNRITAERLGSLQQKHTYVCDRKASLQARCDYLSDLTQDMGGALP